MFDHLECDLNKPKMEPFRWKFVVFLMLTSLSLLSKSTSDIEKSVDVLEGIKIISDNKTDGLDENVEPFSDVPQLNDGSTTELSEEKEDKHFRYRKSDPDEIQIVYWYYDKISAVILGIFFGLALDIENAKEIVKQPIGPSIAVFSRFILSPFVSRNRSREMKMFFTN